MVYNISLIGTGPITNTIIQCNSSVSIVMINIAGLTIRSIVIKDCGPEHSAVNAHEHLFHNKAVTINDCSSVYLQNVIVDSSSNKGLLVINFIDRIVLSAVTSTGVVCKVTLLMLEMA